MEMARYSNRMNPFVFVFLAGLLVIGALFLAASVVRNQEHANAKHIEAPVLRSRIKNDLCSSTEFYFSPVRGTFLVLCQFDSGNWGGIPIRFTENNGQTLLGDEAYECTAFVAPRSYWDAVIKRDGYIDPRIFGNGDLWVEFLRWFQVNYM